MYNQLAGVSVCGGKESVVHRPSFKIHRQYLTNENNNSYIVDLILMKLSQHDCLHEKHLLFVSLYEICTHIRKL